MAVINDLIQTVSSMKLTDFIDILLLAFLIYKVFPLMRSSGAARIAKAVIFLVVVSWVTDWLDMYAIHFVTEQVMTVGLIALVVLFQPELRRIMDHIGNVKLGKIFSADRTSQEMEGVIAQTVMACELMSRDKVGALIVFARDNHLDEYIKTGTQIDGRVTEQLLRNIFFPKAALHDGAMIVTDGRVTAAGCVLPLSQSKRLSADLGTRHRAGVGMSEVSDAVVVIVSEETGTISMAVDGMLKRHLAPQMLERMLRNELISEPADTKMRPLKLHKNPKEGKHEK
jgi:diadenylate cyclase